MIGDPRSNDIYFIARGEIYKFVNLRLKEFYKDENAAGYLVIANILNKKCSNI